MEFTRYIWDLYVNTDQGREALSKDPDAFSDVAATITVAVLEEDESGGYVEQAQENVETIEIDLSQTVKKFVSEKNVAGVEEANAAFRLMIDEGIRVSVPRDGRICFYEIGGEEFEHEVFGNIATISLSLYGLLPDYFIPYLFACRFDEFYSICQAFKIPIPSPPGKTQKRDRALYYLALNDALQEFRQKHGLAPREMCAFLYDFAPRVVAAERDVELPPPSRVWFTMGGVNNNGDFDTLDTADESSESMWQGNIETRRGDVIMMCVIRIDKCIKVPPVHFKEFACDPTLAQNPFVRSHFQGAGGKPFPLEDYLTVLGILKGKGFDISCLPIPPSQTLDIPKNLECERDIEIYLVEPMLKSLGYSEDDWIRQMPLRMGRGERNYPDYAVGANPKRGEESAAFLVEAKYEIATKKQLDDGYLQGKSYALRLQSQAFLLAAMEGVWLFLRAEEFSRERASHWTWGELEHPDRLHELSSRVGKARLSAHRRSPRPRTSRGDQSRRSSDAHFTS